MPSFAVSCRLNTKDTERKVALLRQRAPNAIARALNRAGNSAVTAMIRVISADTGIKRADLKGTTPRNRRIWTHEARPGNEVITVFADLKRIPLYDFGAKGPYPSRGKGRGVTARLRGGATTRYPHAFIATMRSGHTGVFQRMGGKRRGGPPHYSQLPIYELMGPSIAHVWTKHADVGVKRAQEQLLKNLTHEFKFATGRVGSRAA
jgi:hypothetical protein